MILACPLCGGALGEVEPGLREPLEHVCPSCGNRLLVKRLEEQPAPDDAGTVAQPRLMIETLGEPDAGTLATSPGSASGAEGSPPLPAGVGGFFMVLGAPVGAERIRLERARTVFGRSGADVEIDDPTLAARHFQVDAVGREFYLRDLESGYGTRLNGRTIRYVELLPGDEVVAGATVLVFRRPGDGVDRRP